MAPATSQGDRVLVRTVLVTRDGLDVWFFTWGGSRKCEQIRAHPHAALCKDRVRIEGTAEILGGPIDPVNATVRGLFEERFPETVENRRDRPGMVLVKIALTLIDGGRGPGEEPRLEFVNLQNRIAYAEPWATGDGGRSSQYGPRMCCATFSSYSSASVLCNASDSRGIAETTALFAACCGELAPGMMTVTAS